MTVTPGGTVLIGSTTDVQGILQVNAGASGATVARINRTTAVTNAVGGVLNLVHTSTGDIANGFGTMMSFYARDLSGVDYLLGYIGMVRAGGDSFGDFVVYPSGVEKFRFTSGGTLKVLGTTESMSTTTGSIVASGGLGIAGNAWVGGSLNVATTIEASTITANDNIVTNGTLSVRTSLALQADASITLAPGQGRILINGHTGNTTPFVLNANELTSASAIEISVNALTTGRGVSVFQIADDIGAASASVLFLAQGLGN